MADSRNILIVGPPRAGKTCLLSAAHLEGNFTSFQGGDAQSNIIPKNPKMISLLEDARRTIQSGSLMNEIDATTVTAEYEFDLRITYSKRSLFRARESVTSFRFLDGPGGALLPNAEDADEIDQMEIDEFRETLLEYARISHGLLLCVDSTDEAIAKLFFIYLPTLFANIGTLPLHFDRMVILLTKSDSYFVKEKRNARAAATQANAWQRAAELLTDPQIGNLIGYLGDHTEVACGWSSAYGFVPKEGTANFDARHNRLRTYDPRTQTASPNSWQPFRTLDPFVFLATGEKRSLQTYKRKDLQRRPWKQTQ